MATVDSKAIVGRRQLSFQTLDEAVADAERLVASPSTRALGNWPLNNLLMHMGTAINSSIDGISAKAPLFLRLIGPFMKRRIFRKGMPPGIRLPKAREAAFFPAASSTEEALRFFRTAAARVRQEKMTARHPALGPLTHEEWLLLHRRHAELHLSFIVPE